MKGLYKFYWDCGRMGELSGIFIAEKDELYKLIGTEIYFGEVLGKHSEIYGKLEEKDLELLSDDSEVISILEKVLPRKMLPTISGYNPMKYVQEDEGE